MCIVSFPYSSHIHSQSTFLLSLQSTFIGDEQRASVGGGVEPTITSNLPSSTTDQSLFHNDGDDAAALEEEAAVGFASGIRLTQQQSPLAASRFIQDGGYDDDENILGKL